MTESWDSFVKHKRKEFGTKEIEVKTMRIPAPRHAIKEISRVKPEERMFNLHKRSMPPGIDKPILFNFPSKAAAEYAIEHTVKKDGTVIFAMKRYQNDVNEQSTYIFYEPVPTDATPNERNIYFNPGPLTTKPIEGYKPPKRIN